MKKIVLLGYMGCGKSVISKKLSNFIKIPFVDLDEMIEKKCQMPIEKIFSTKGELYFRKTENQLLIELLEDKCNLIISTGGGTPCYFNNLELLKNKNVISIYLKSSIDTLFDRLINEKKNRPLIAKLKDEDLKEFIAKHLFERSYFYNQATYTVNVDTKNSEEIINNIIKIVNS